MAEFVISWIREFEKRRNDRKGSKYDQKRSKVRKKGSERIKMIGKDQVGKEKGSVLIIWLIKYKWGGQPEWVDENRHELKLVNMNKTGTKKIRPCVYSKMGKYLKTKWKKACVERFFIYLLVKLIFILVLTEYMIRKKGSLKRI